MFTIYYLQGCPYSEAALTLLKPLKHKIVTVTQNTKNEFKKKLNISTFPLITFSKSLSTSKTNPMRIGGYTQLKQFVKKL